MYINVLTADSTVTMERSSVTLSMVTSFSAATVDTSMYVDDGGGDGGGGDGGGGGGGGSLDLVSSKKIIKINNRIRNKWSLYNIIHTYQDNLLLCGPIFYI